MTNGTLLRAKGNHMPFIIIGKVKINRHLDWDGMVLVEIDGYKVARTDRINHPFIVDEEDFHARFEVVA
jgi:hypothetical protein